MIGRRLRSKVLKVDQSREKKKKNDIYIIRIIKLIEIVYYHIFRCGTAVYSPLLCAYITVRLDFFEFYTSCIVWGKIVKKLYHTQNGYFITTDTSTTH